jgi:hypothetical protein
VVHVLVAATIFSKHRWKKRPTDVFVVIIKVLHNKQSWYGYENDSIAVINLLLEKLVFLAGGLDHGCEMEQLRAFFMVEKMVFAFFPRLLKIYQSCDKVSIVFKLRIDAFYIFVIFSEKLSKAKERLADCFCKSSNCF